MTRVKICGLTRAQDAELAVELGADALGFVFEPSSPRCMAGDPEMMGLPLKLGPYVTCVQVFGQLPDRFEPAAGFAAVQTVYGDVGSRPSWWIRAFRRRGEETVDAAVASMQGAGALLLDAYNPKQFGGTGETIDWGFAKEVVEKAGVPVILAGGLSVDNIAKAVRYVKPYAVDVSSGIESTPGIKDAELMKAFIELVRKESGS